MVRLTLDLPSGPAKHLYQLCDNPEEAIWREILRYAEPFYLKKIWDAGKNEELLEFVFTSVRQSYEYYRASKNIGENTSPLLLYYSCHNLTKAILTLENDKKDGLSHHGLTTNRDGRKKELFEYTTTQCDTGVFPALAKVFGAEWAHNNKVSFSFYDFAANSIECSFDLNDSFNLEPTLLPVECSRNTDGVIKLLVLDHDESQLIKNRDLISKKTKILDHFALEEGKYTKKFTDKNEMENQCIGLLKALNFNFCYLPCNEKIIYLDISEKKIPQACCYYGMIYILGMIVRYSPEILGHILNAPNSKYRWLVEEVCRHVRRLYPLYMLNLLTKKSLKFVTALQ